MQQPLSPPRPPAACTAEAGMEAHLRTLAARLPARRLDCLGSVDLLQAFVGISAHLEGLGDDPHALVQALR